MTLTAITSPHAFPTVSGCRIVEELYLGSRTAVYRAMQTATQQPVVIKVLLREYPSFGELVQFRNQYTIAKNLSIPGIVQPLSLEPLGSGYALVMEDWGGVALGKYLQQQALDLSEILEIALQLADILHDLGQHRVVHKDIKPANILIQPESKQVKLIDFSIASLLPKETQEIQSPNILEGTLAYLAPEQTGRMNRGIDYRADFYAFGVTLYQLLTGTLPFASDDPLELMHCHIAKLPVPADQVNPEVPAMVAAIVSKLMAKNAEDRYQSAMGLKHDLQHCLTQWQETGKITAFELGQRDLSDRFLIPEKLYGRETEVQILLDAFDRVAGGSSELMLVAGFSGIGKTAVVNEVHKPIVRQRGYFIKGKFDQFNRNIPLSAFVQALRGLMGQLLSESDDQLAQWQRQILTVVGENGQVLIEVIPELEQIIGKQSPASELSGTAAQNRFNLLFQKFIAVFTTADHPLVLFLDDLQWADLASLQLLKLLMNDHGHLLILGAYRDNEVSPVHLFMMTIEELKKTGEIVNTITLAPLAFEDTNQLVADTLHCSTQLATPLTELIDRKTQGNPFFTTQFLKALHDDGYIRFNRVGGASQHENRRYWECDIAQVHALALTDDVVEFMALQLQKLPEATQQMLKLAACVGNQFDLATLAIVSEQLSNDAATALWKALQEGFILPTSQVYKFFQSEDSEHPDPQNIGNPGYRFLHDRVQQAAYSLIPKAQKQLTHWQIGQLLLQELSQQEQVEQIFDIVNQLNLGRATVVNPIQNQQLAQLNLQAGQKAKLASAYQSAQNYYEVGISLLPTSAWQTDYALTYALHRNASESAYLCGNFDQAEKLYAATLAQAQTPLDKAVIYRVQMTQYQLQGRNTEAIAIQRQSLQLLGWAMPIEPERIQANLDEQIAAVNRFLENQTIASILEFSPMQDDNIAEMLRILQILFYAAWLDGQPTLALLALAKMTTLSLQYGNSDMSPFGYVGYGLIANAVLKNAAQAYQFGDMAVQLCEQFDNADVRGMTNFLFAADVHSWSRPLRAADTYYDNAFKYGMDAGNWLTVGFMMMQSGSDRLTYGKKLDDLYAIAQAHADFLHQIKSFENLDALMVGVLQPIRHLLGLTATPFSFDDDSFSEAEYLQKYHNAPYHLAWFYSVKIRHAYLFDQQAAYPDLIPQLNIIETTISSHAKVPSSVFYVALMHLALIEGASDETERQSHWQAIFSLEERLNHWQQDCPENIEHKCFLIQAEKARLNGQKSEAIDLYDQSIAQAQAHGYRHKAALANELAAQFYLNWGKEKIAQTYLTNAYYGYAHWGAKAKVRDLEQRYPQLLAPILQQKRAALSATETVFATEALTAFQNPGSHYSSSGSTSISDTLDLATVLKASQTLSSEIQLDKLLATLLHTVLENAGADKGALLMPQENQWFVEAVATVDQPVQVQSIALSDSPELPHSLIQTVKHSLQPVVIVDATVHSILAGDTYVIEQQPKSLLCTPILQQGKLVAILYLENQVTVGAFTSDRVQLLNFLCTQAAISLENARLYQQSNQVVQQQEQMLEQLNQSQVELKRTQGMLQLVINNIPGAVFWKDLNSVYLGCNQYFAEIGGLNSSDQIINKTDYDLPWNREESDFFRECDRKVMDSGIAEIGIIEPQLQSNGKETWLETNKVPLRDIHNKVIGIIGTFQDVTDRKQAEKTILQKSQELEQALTVLQNTQLQMVQSEKMASLGNLVAGVAHEVNNPIGFLNGSINNAKEYVQDIIGHLALYQQHYPDPAAPIQENAEDIDLEFLTQDFPKLLDSMTGASDRIKGISTSLRTFSRADTEYKVRANLHEGIDSTLLILKYRLKANENRPAIEVIQDYGNLSPIKCFPGQLNQVFMNIVANAIDALEESNRGRSFEEIQATPNQITIKTEVSADRQVLIRIQDNGKGMTEEVQAKIFDHLFTTKSVGKGTGLGLAIARQIVVEKHGGSLHVQSELGQGTEFCIRLPIPITG